MTKHLCAAITVVALVAGGMTTSRARQEPIRAEQVAEQFVAAYNEHEVDKLMAFFADDVVVSTPDLTIVKGAADNRKYYQAWFKSVPDVNSTIKSLTADENRFVLELVESGTYKKTLPSPGAPRAHGQKLRYPYVIVANVKSGKMTSVRFYENDKVIEQQMGIR